MKYGIVIPCYNESERLPFKEFTHFLETHPDHICCFVNDGSEDDTLLELLAFKLKTGRQVVIYDMPKNSGKAEAVRYGVNRLLQIESIEQIGFLDADLATGFDDYTHLEQTLVDHSYSIVFGSRNDEQSMGIDRDPIRKVISTVIGFMIKMILRLPIRDTQCGAKVFSRQAASYIFSVPFKTRWLFDVEIFLRLKIRAKSTTMRQICEIPLRSWNDVDGSKLKTKDAIQIPVMLLKIAFTQPSLTLREDILHTKQAA